MMGAIQDEQLALDQNGLSNHARGPPGPSNRAIFARMSMKRAARSRMPEHGDKIAKCRNLQKLTIRQGHVSNDLKKRRRVCQSAEARLKTRRATSDSNDYRPSRI